MLPVWTRQGQPVGEVYAEAKALLGLDIVDGIRRINLQGDGLANIEVVPCGVASDRWEAFAPVARYDGGSWFPHRRQALFVCY
jgi:hypothetical protein